MPYTMCWTRWLAERRLHFIGGFDGNFVEVVLGPTDLSAVRDIVIVPVSVELTAQRALAQLTKTRSGAFASNYGELIERGRKFFTFVRINRQLLRQCGANRAVFCFFG